MKWFTIEACAGGGGSGFCVGAPSGATIAGSGGSGAYARVTYTPSVFNTTSGIMPLGELMINVGVGGAGATDNTFTKAQDGGPTIISRQYLDQNENTQLETLFMLAGGQGSLSALSSSGLFYLTVPGASGGNLYTVTDTGLGMLQLRGQNGQVSLYYQPADWIVIGNGGLTPIGTDNTLSTGYGQGAAGNYATTGDSAGSNGNQGVCIITEYY